jgi:hypothetical protein
LCADPSSQLISFLSSKNTSLVLGLFLESVFLLCGCVSRCGVGFVSAGAKLGAVGQDASHFSSTWGTSLAR